MCNSHCLCFKLPAIATAGSAGIRLGERGSQRCVVASRVRGRLKTGLGGDWSRVRGRLDRGDISTVKQLTEEILVQLNS